jgi:hypothetical protein
MTSASLAMPFWDVYQINDVTWLDGISESS